MLLNEYQSHLLLQRFQIPCIQRYIVDSEELLNQTLLKAHIQAGQVRELGQKKSVHSKIEGSNIEIQEETIKILKRGKKAVVVPHIEREKELFLSISIDYEYAFHILQFSQLNGPIYRETLSQKQSLHRYQLVRIMKQLQIEGALQKELASIIGNLIHAYFHLEASKIELSPLILTEQNTFLLLNAQIEIDNAALFRQKEMAYLTKEEDIEISDIERRAKKSGFSYRSMAGNIATLANGRALALSVVDSLHFWGGSAANLLDIGETITPKKIELGIDLLLSHTEIQLIYLHLFFGSMECKSVLELILNRLADYVQYKGGAIPAVVIQMEGLLCEQAKREIQMRLTKKASILVQFFSSINESSRYAAALSKQK